MAVSTSSTGTRRDVGLRQGDRLAVEDGEQLSDEDPVGHPFRRTRTGESVDEVIEGQLAGPELEEVARDDLPLLSGCPGERRGRGQRLAGDVEVEFNQVRPRALQGGAQCLDAAVEIGERGLGHDAAR
jgi:hypothetical protein